MIFWLGTFFLLVTAAQITIVFIAVRLGSYSGVEVLYRPASLLADMFIRVRSEADVGAGLVFVPPVMLFYSLVLTTLAGVLKRRHGR